MAEESEGPEEKEVDTDDEALLKASREGLSERISAESDQRALMRDDQKFSALDQWPADIRAAREADILNGPRPCLTLDQINQYTTQVCNEMQKNKPSIKPRPVDSGADPETAKIFAGLIRHIEDQSSAKIAYQTAAESAVDIGLGFFRIVPEYVSPDSFDQELVIKRVPDTFSVYLGHHIMPDGSDAEKGWVFEAMPLEQFNRDYPKAKHVNADFDGLGSTPAWRSEKTVTVCEYLYKKYTPVALVFLADGRTMDRKDYEKLSEPRPEITGERASHKVSVKWVKHSGIEVLERSELKTKYIPIIEEVGKEKIVEGKRILWGLVRPAKDSLRALNYWVSALTEKMALTPKAPVIGAVGQFATQGDRWDKANTVNYAKLEYDAIEVNGNVVAAPRRSDPMQMEPAMVGLIGMLQNFVKSALGMYKASVGDTDSQQSGRAILALKNESDTGTAHFGENQVISITHAGRILIDWAPAIYDKKRVLRILGEDGKAGSAQIDPEQKESMREFRGEKGEITRIYNLNVGKFDVTPTVGPGYTTSRQEAATVMTELANSAKDPISAAIMRYGAVKNSDFAGSDEIMGMLKAMLPPQVKPPEDGQEPMPPAAMQKIAQLTQGVHQLQMQLQEVGQENMQLKAKSQEGMAKIKVQEEEVRAELALQKEKQDGELSLAREKAEAEIDIKQRVAAADHGIAERKLKFEQDCRANDDAAKMEERLKGEEAPLLENAMPRFVQSFDQITKTFAQALEENNKAVAQLAQAVIQGAQAENKPKTITAKSSSGLTMSATIQ